MKNSIKLWAMFMGFMMMALFIADIQAQAQQGQPGRGRFMGETAKVFCDVLVLDASKAEEVVAIYNKSRETAMSGQQQPDWQSMSQEERRTQMTKIQKEIAADFKQKVAGKLTEQQIKDIDPLLSQRFTRPVVELRALRLIALKPEQIKAVQPLALDMAKAMIREEGASPEDMQKKIDEQKVKFVEKVNAVLGAEQKTAWTTKTDEVKKEMEEQMQRMRQGGQGGGQGR